MDTEALALPDACVDVVMCALGLMYVPLPERALREMRRVLHEGGRMGAAVRGSRARCGWSPVFPIVDAKVASDVCPLFFRRGDRDVLVNLCANAGFTSLDARALATTLTYSDANETCDAAFAAGPVALAWSRFDDTVRARVRARYLAAIAPWRSGLSCRIPAEFIIVVASAAQSARA